jgi:acetoacetyl-CoA synthetase
VLDPLTVAFFAGASVGAVWSSASVDFGPSGVLDRFSQVGPRLLVVAEEAIYKGRRHSLVANIDEILRSFFLIFKLKISKILFINLFSILKNKFFLSF